MIIAYLTVGILHHLIIWAKTLIFLKEILSSFLRFSSGSDSFKANIIIPRVIAEIKAPRIAVHKNETLLHTEREPRAGHTKSEKPKTAPLVQNTLDLSSGSLMSASTAWATEAFHHVIPSNTLERNTTSIGNNTNQNNSVSGSIYAIHNTIQLSNVQACVRIKIGFRP